MSNNKQGQIKRKQLKDDSFLEAFRELGSSMVSPLNKPGSDENMSFGDIYSQNEALEQKYRQKVTRIEQLHREEKILFTREQRETTQHVQALQEEIKKFAKATGELAREAEITAMQEPTTSGIYHVNFLEQLISSLKIMRQQIQESSFWLASWNKKSQKKNAYWSGFKKSGSKFLLSADRYMATQAG